MKNLIFCLILVVTSFVTYSQCNRYQIYESFTNTLTTQGGTWAVNSILASTTPVRTGGYAAGFNSASDWIRTPQIANPGVLTFWYRRSTNTTAWPLLVQTSPDGVTWTTRSSVTNATTTYQQHTLNIGALGLTNVFIRLFDNRTSGTHVRYVDDLGITSAVTNENTLIPFLANCSQTLTSSLTYTITDAGGPTDTYNNSLNQTVTFTPSDNTKKLKLDFSVFNLEDNFDYLYVYDGPNTSSTLLATLSGTAIPASITADNASGQLTLRFTSDGSAVRVGFQATLTSITPPPVCTIPTEGGTLTSNKLETVVNDAILLTTTGNGGSTTLIEWSFNNFSTVSGSVANPANPYGIVLNVQQSSVYFRTTSQDGVCPIGVSNIIEVTLINAPVFTNGVNDGDYITNVTLANINNTSTNDGDAYEDFTSLIIELNIGDSYELLMSSTVTVAPGQGKAAWIDFNQDGTFQTSENIMQKAPASSVSQVFTVPEGTLTGDTKMRVISVWNATPSTDAYNSAGYGYGEIEEYTVRMTAPVSLPIELISFNAICSDEVVLINWQTASEHNTSHFNLERSRNGIDWEVIHTEGSSINSIELITYNFTDKNVISGTNYYRLNQYDLDGVYEQFGPISINCLKSNDQYFSIFPNPSSNTFSVILNNKNLIGESVLTITNDLGKIIYTKNLSVLIGINLYIIEKLEVTPGVYYILILNDNYTSGVLKQVIR